MNPGTTALIMMVDDTPTNLSVLSDLLSARGFKISVAEDGESALEQLQYVRPDLILLDVLIPAWTGSPPAGGSRSVRKRGISRSSS